MADETTEKKSSRATGPGSKASKYDSMVKPYLDKIPEMAETMTEEQIARAFGVGKSTFSMYKTKHTELVEAIKKGRQNLVSDLRSVLIMRAKGFSKTTTKYMKCKVVDYDPTSGKRLQEREELVSYEQEDYYPPDVASLNLALKNYDSTWRNDPAEYELKKQSLALQKEKLEKDMW